MTTFARSKREIMKQLESNLFQTLIGILSVCHIVCVNIPLKSLTVISNMITINAGQQKFGRKFFAAVSLSKWIDCHLIS